MNVNKIGVFSSLNSATGKKVQKGVRTLVTGLTIGTMLVASNAKGATNKKGDVFVKQEPAAAPVVSVQEPVQTESKVTPSYAPSPLTPLQERQILGALNDVGVETNSLANIKLMSYPKEMGVNAVGFFDTNSFSSFIKDQNNTIGFSYTSDDGKTKYNIITNPSKAKGDSVFALKTSTAENTYPITEIHKGLTKKGAYLYKINKDKNGYTNIEFPNNDLLIGVGTSKVTTDFNGNIRITTAGKHSIYTIDASAKKETLANKINTINKTIQKQNSQKIAKLLGIPSNTMKNMIYDGNNDVVSFNTKRKAYTSQISEDGKYTIIKESDAPGYASNLKRELKFDNKNNKLVQEIRDSRATVPFTRTIIDYVNHTTTKLNAFNGQWMTPQQRNAISNLIVPLDLKEGNITKGSVRFTPDDNVMAFRTKGNVYSVNYSKDGKTIEVIETDAPGIDGGGVTKYRIQNGQLQQKIHTNYSAYGYGVRTTTNYQNGQAINETKAYDLFSNDVWINEIEKANVEYALDKIGVTIGQVNNFRIEAGGIYGIPAVMQVPDPVSFSFEANGYQYKGDSNPSVGYSNKLYVEQIDKDGNVSVIVDDDYVKWIKAEVNSALDYLMGVQVGGKPRERNISFVDNTMYPDMGVYAISFEAHPENTSSVFYGAISRENNYGDSIRVTQQEVDGSSYTLYKGFSSLNQGTPYEYAIFTDAKGNKVYEDRYNPNLRFYIGQNTLDADANYLYVTNSKYGVGYVFDKGNPEIMRQQIANYNQQEQEFSLNSLAQALNIDSEQIVKDSAIFEGTDPVSFETDNYRYTVARIDYNTIEVTENVRPIMTDDGLVSVDGAGKNVYTLHTSKGNYDLTQKVYTNYSAAPDVRTITNYVNGKAINTTTEHKKFGTWMGGFEAWNVDYALKELGFQGEGQSSIRNFAMQSNYYINPNEAYSVFDQAERRVYDPVSFVFDSNGKTYNVNVNTSVAGNCLYAQEIDYDNNTILEILQGNGPYTDNDIFEDDGNKYGQFVTIYNSHTLNGESSPFDFERVYDYNHNLIDSKYAIDDYNLKYLYANTSRIELIKIQQRADERFDKKYNPDLKHLAPTQSVFSLMQDGWYNFVNIDLSKAEEPIRRLMVGDNGERYYTSETGDSIFVVSQKPNSAKVKVEYYTHNAQNYSYDLVNSYNVPVNIPQVLYYLYYDQCWDNPQRVNDIYFDIINNSQN